MPTLCRMSDEKQTAEDDPAVVIAGSTPPAQPRKMKKYVIIAVSAILSAAIILAAILVGMYMFTEAQKDIVKYTLNLSKNSKQEVTSDPNTNIVQYHVTRPGHETWIINDFNKDIQVVKIQTDTSTNCYVSALNRTSAMDPSKIVKPETTDVKSSSSLTYVTSNTPISDTSFLSKTARDACNGISIYWVYPRCLDQESALQNTTQMPAKTKRDIDGSPFYYMYTYYNGYRCIMGCCKIICSYQLYYTYYYFGGYVYCIWYVYDYSYLYYGCAYGPGGLICPNQYPPRWNTC